MNYDLIVIGSGPGGYVAAIRASQLGMKVAVVERESIGGICLNWGCIPTKTLLNSAKHYLHAQEAEAFGVNVKDVSFDLEKAMSWKEDVIKSLRAGIEFMMKKFKVEVVSGEAKLLGPGKVQVAPPSWL